MLTSTTSTSTSTAPSHIILEDMGIRRRAFHIPTIDIRPYLRDPTSEAAAKVVRDVRNACMSVGFFSLVGHGLPRKMQNDLFAAAKKLFDLPLEEKLALRHPRLKNRGYELIGSQSLQEDTLPDLKEASRPRHPSTVLLSRKSEPSSNTTSGILPGEASAC